MLDCLVPECHCKTPAQVIPRDRAQQALDLHQLMGYLQQMRLQMEELHQAAQELFPCLLSDPRIKNEFSS